MLPHHHHHQLSPSTSPPPLSLPLSQLIDFYSEAVRRLHSVTIMDASAAHLVRAGAAGAVAGPLGLATAHALIIPLNNADPAAPPPPPGSAPAGSHWSVLAFHRQSWSWRHYDSCAGAGGLAGNAAAAAGLAAELGPWQGCQGGAVVPRLTTSPAAPRQANGSDCGLHACLTVRALAGVLGGSSGRGGGGGSGEVWVAADAAVAAAATPAAAAAARAGLRACIAAAEAAGPAAREGGWVPPGLP